MWELQVLLVCNVVVTLLAVPNHEATPHSEIIGLSMEWPQGTCAQLNLLNMNNTQHKCEVKVKFYFCQFQNLKKLFHFIELFGVLTVFLLYNFCAAVRRNSIN